MKNLNATFARSYKKLNKNGVLTDVFVYHIGGNAESIAAYKQVQGEFYREDEESKKGLYFSTRFVGDTVKLIITEKGNVVADMSEFSKAASLASQFGGNLGQELARAAASKLMGGHTEPTAPVQPTVQNVQADSSLLED